MYKVKEYRGKGSTKRQGKATYPAQFYGFGNSDDNLFFCNGCGEWHSYNEKNGTTDGQLLCDSCFEKWKAENLIGEESFVCLFCGERRKKADMSDVWGVCSKCFDENHFPIECGV